MQGKQEYCYADDAGDAQISVYDASPGVEAAYVTAHMGTLDFGLFERSIQRHYLGVHYCREGRIEQVVGNEFLYLMPGDCVVAIQNRVVKQFHFPTKHYHGISIGIDLDALDGPLLSCMAANHLSPRKSAKQLCGEKNYVVLRHQTALQAFFASLYAVEEAQRTAYLPIKLPELFFLLSHVHHPHVSGAQTVSRAQVELVKAVAEEIATHIGEKITLRELTERYNVSDTYLQSSFRSVYGMPVMSFVRAQKMQSAAQILIHTDRSVGQIAQEMGYENESKFSAAFKKIMGDAPGVYRREHSKLHIL